MGEFYLTLGMLWAILIGLSTVIVGPCISRLTKAILEPALLAFTTSSSEAAFPGTSISWKNSASLQNRQLRPAHRLLL
jgi:Na+/H+-dicarboxylate symporter